jgi:hypothetical protein
LCSKHGVGFQVFVAEVFDQVVGTAIVKEEKVFIVFLRVQNNLFSFFSKTFKFPKLVELKKCGNPIKLKYNMKKGLFSAKSGFKHAFIFEIFFEILLLIQKSNCQHIFMQN